MRSCSWMLGALVAAGVGLGVVPGCGSDGVDGAGPDGGPNPGIENPDLFGGGDSGADAKGPCRGLECQQVDCGAGASTSLSGIVYDPAGQIPLYNVIVYVPNAPLDPIKDGATCDRCGGVASGAPVVTTLTDAKGQFQLKDVPVGTNIPLVIQVGKWRREIVIPKVEACKDTVLTKPPTNDTERASLLTRLPRNRKEGHMPLMAITTGGCDPLPCLFSRLGIDAAEFISPDETDATKKDGRVHVFKGVGGGGVAGSAAAPDPQTALWNDAAKLKRYDMVILSCECSEHNETKPAGSMTAMRDFMNAGGRVFATHYHYTWFKNNPDGAVKGVANWTSGSTGTPYTVDDSFPKGRQFRDWLQNVGATTTPGSIVLNSVASDLSTVNPSAQRWIYRPATSPQPEGVKYMTFNTPVGTPAAQQCGRAVLSDIHVSSGQNASTVPTSCTKTALTAQEKALAFLFFDLSSCVQDDKVAPEPPPVPR